MTTELREHMKTIGKRGGKKTAKRGKKYYLNIGKKGLQKRWGVDKTAK